MSDDIERRVEWLEYAMRVTRERVLEHYAASSCIATSMTLADVYMRAGIACRPMSVALVVLNAALAERIARDEWDGTFKSDEWSVGVGVRRDAKPTLDFEQNLWNGHLVLIAKVADELDVLVDASLDQASRDEHNLSLAPSVFVLPPDYLALQYISYLRGDGVALRYTLRPSDLSYRATGDYQKRDKRERIVRVVNATMRMDRAPYS